MVYWLQKAVVYSMYPFNHEDLVLLKKNRYRNYNNSKHLILIVVIVKTSMCLYSKC